MPGPGSKQKSKKAGKKSMSSTPKGEAPSSRVPEGLVAAVADVVEWSAIEDVLVNLFGLPGEFLVSLTSSYGDSKR
jgi:hypothetical protein